MAQRKRKGRPVDGILLLDKPVGITSNLALQKVKRLFGAQKAGHTGSLDPLASGMLPICLGEATKFSQFLLDSDKHYQTVGRLGIKTTTADADGEVVETKPVEVTAAQIEAQLARFRGDILQVPSMYSALKHEGRPLYELARAGETVEREARPVTIHRLELLGYECPDMRLDVLCSKGTYIRNLVEDLGEALGCGAHVAVLRRLMVNEFPESAMVSWERLEQALAEGGQDALDALLLPMDAGIQSFPALTLGDSMSFYFRQGQPVRVRNAPLDGWVRCYDESGRFLGMGEMDEEARVAPRRLVVVPQD